MSDITKITFSNVINNLLPIQYRINKMLAWLNSLISVPIQWLRDIFFDGYMNSNTSFTFFDGINNFSITNANTYIRCVDNSVWMTLVDGVQTGVNNPLLGQLTSGSTIVWQKVLNNCIGFTERLYFNDQKIMFEYLLNRYFNPNDYTNKIYIQLNDIKDQFIVYTDDISSIVTRKDTDYNVNYIYSECVAVGADFTIYVPSQITIDLGTSYQDQISSIVNIYNMDSITYNYQIY